MISKFIKENLSDPDFYLDIILILITVFIVRTFIVSPFWVSGPSMCDTLNYKKDHCEWGKGDIMIINSLGYLDLGFYKFGEPENNDIVVFKMKDSSGRYLVKRIIASEGETIKIENGYVYKKIDGSYQKLNEPYLNSENKHQTLLSFTNSEEFTVPKNHYFLMGDNRLNSSDSRNCFYKSGSKKCSSTNMDAYVHRNQIRGKSLVVLYPFYNFGTVE